jgi:hypothetical protein
VNEKSLSAAFGIICKDCKIPFYIGKKEAEWYSNMGFPLPKRCSTCRKERKERNARKNRRVKNV